MNDILEIYKYLGLPRRITWPSGSSSGGGSIEATPKGPREGKWLTKLRGGSIMSSLTRAMAVAGKVTVDGKGERMAKWWRMGG